VSDEKSDKLAKRKRVCMDCSRETENETSETTRKIFVI